MILTITDILSQGDIAALRDGLGGAAFASGELSAGWQAQRVKSNLQACESPEIDAMRSLVRTRLLEHPVFALATRPKIIIGPLFARYLPGHSYGAHVDNALICGARADVSFTLFLSDPLSY